MSEDSRLITAATAIRQFISVRTARYVKRDGFRRLYLIVAACVLGLTTIYWAYLGAKLQSHNADQLVDPYLFSNWHTFHAAIFPSAHTFLVKWPLFLLVAVTGGSTIGLTIATILVAGLTIAFLAFVIAKIERRPLVRGTYFLVLALMLLLVPAQPYAGGILPVNMAMLTTRNVEYVLYIAALYFLIRARMWRSRPFYVGLLLLGLLFASDKLFFGLSVGGSLLMLSVYAALRNWNFVNLAVRWLAATIGAFVLSAAALAFINLTKLTSVSGATASPYAIIDSTKSAITAVIYSVTGFFTNFGANPVYDNRLVARLPSELFHRLFSLTAPLYIIAFVFSVYATIVTIRLARGTLQITNGRPAKLSQATCLSVALVASTVAAFAVFIFTQHYYAVDARYLMISLFAVSICTATALRTYRWKNPQRLVYAGAGLVVVIIAATFTATNVSHGQQTALSDVSNRNQTVLQALNHHKVSTLIGDYWRVIPIKDASQGKQLVMPLGNCTQPTPALTSTSWQPDLHGRSFAYLLSLDGSLTGFPACSVAQVTAAYGKPNASQLIAGTVSQPKELLLFFDTGIHKPQHPQNHRSSASVTTPLEPADLRTQAACNQPTVMNIVAHQDDDLLFLSPDLLHDIHAGKCVRTVYLTAGDGGQDQFYWLSRQQGTEAAYDAMLGKKQQWYHRTLHLGNGQYATIACPRGNPKISLVFFNLPDGGLTGSGFPSSGSESLQKLRSGAISAMRSVDGQSEYTGAQLTQALVTLMGLYQPAAIHTQADVQNESFPDHSDHKATGHYATEAANLYDQQHFDGAISIPVSYYIGYPIRSSAENISGEDLSQKEQAFFAYAQHDGGVCHSFEQCAHTPTYGSYLDRQYQVAE